eukprot:218832-Hanusia_phi.AAC.1
MCFTQPIARIGGRVQIKSAPESQFMTSRHRTGCCRSRDRRSPGVARARSAPVTVQIIGLIACQVDSRSSSLNVMNNC